MPPDSLDVTNNEDVTPSLGDALTAALERQELVPPAPAATPAEPAVSRPAPSADDKAGAVPGPARDAFGRFQPKTDTPASPAAPATPGAAPAPATPGVAAAPIEAPASWRDDLKPLFGKLPEPVREYMHQRENELQQGFQRVAQRANVAESVLNEFTPYAEILAQEKATPIDAIRTLLQTAHALRTGGPEYKKAIILGLVQQYGVDMTTQLNPAQARTEAELAALSTEKMYGTARQTTEQSKQVEQEFNAFANDPVNEFFPQVRQIMGGLVGQGFAKNLREAYDMAVGMHPDVRQTIWNRAQQAAVNAPRKQAAANMSVRNSPGGGSNVVHSKANGKAEDTSIRASIEAALGES